MPSLVIIKMSKMIISPISLFAYSVLTDISNNMTFPHPYSSVQFSSVTQSCLILFNTMDCSTPGLPVHHQIPEFTQTHAHWVGDAFQTYHPLSSPSSPAFNLSQHQGLYNESVFCISVQSIGVSALASVLPMNIQDWFPLGWTGWISLHSKGLSRVFPNTTLQKHQFSCAQLSL